MMADPTFGGQWLVSEIVKPAHFVETNLYNIYVQIRNRIFNTSWRTGGFIFTLADDCAGYPMSIVMTLFRGEIGSLYDR